MSDITLLDKTRKLKDLLQNATDGKVVFSDICMVLKDLLKASIFIYSKKGKLLGCSYNSKGEQCFPSVHLGEFLPEEVGRRILSVLSTAENISPMVLGLSPKYNADDHLLVSPIRITRERLGTLCVYREDKAYSIDDIILCEYATTVVGLELLRSLSTEQADSERREREVQAALEALSPSERAAIAQVLTYMDGQEGLIVTSRIAEECSMARTVIINALKKLESAGVLETHSAGVKGTRIRIVNDLLNYNILSY